MKPESYWEQEHERCCSKCLFAGWQCNLHDDLMCYRGDSSRDVNESRLLEGDKLDRWWVDRHVYPEGVCEEFREGKPQDVTWSNDYQGIGEIV